MPLSRQGCPLALKRPSESHTPRVPGYAVTKTSKTGKAPLITGYRLHQHAIQRDSETMAEALKKRPSRTGMWCLVHRSRLPKTQHEEVCELWSDFFSHHPNGIADTKDFVGVKLSQAQLKKQKADICLASYKWDAKKSIGGVVHALCRQDLTQG